MPDSIHVQNVRIDSSVEPEALPAGNSGVHHLRFENHWPMDETVTTKSDSRSNGSLRYPGKPDPTEWVIKDLGLAGRGGRWGRTPSVLPVESPIEHDASLAAPTAGINQLDTHCWLGPTQRTIGVLTCDVAC